jgi:hypothetical protein
MILVNPMPPPRSNRDFPVTSPKNNFSKTWRKNPKAKKKQLGARGFPLRILRIGAKRKFLKFLNSPYIYWFSE